MSTRRKSTFPLTTPIRSAELLACAIAYPAHLALPILPKPLVLLTP